MLSESEEQALTKVRSYLRAGHSLEAIRESGWEDWIAHFEKKGVSIGDLEPPSSPLPPNDKEEPAEEAAPHRQPAKRDGTQDVALDRIATPASPSPDPKYAKSNAFAAIGFPALASTPGLRKANGRAQIKLKMARDARPDEAAPSLERLVSDPTFRMREAAAWYFAFGTADEASANEPSSLTPHDSVLARWHSVLDDVSRQAYDSDSFSSACEATADLLRNPQTWQPLQGLAEEIADVRLDANTVYSSAEAAVQRWTCEALFTIAANGNRDNIRDAAEAKLAIDYGSDVVDSLGGEVDAAIEAAVLARAAEELRHIAAAHEAKAEALLERIVNDGSAANELVGEAEELVVASRPWWELVDVFDEDPDSGEEGHALDQIAGMLKSVAVSLANNTQDFGKALQSLRYAQEIAQAGSLRLSLEADLTLVRYLQASTKFMEAVNDGRTEAARGHFADMERNATTDEQRQTVATLRPQIGRLPQQDQNSGGGIPWGKLVWAVIIGGIIISVIVGVIQGSDDESSSGGSSAPSRSVPAVGSSGSSSSGSNAEGLAIDVERVRLEQEADDLETLDVQISTITRRLDSWDAQYPNGLPVSVYDQYEGDRLRHNRLVDQYNDLLAGYRVDIAAFNRRVDTYNNR